jgi:TonB family protein
MFLLLPLLFAEDAPVETSPCPEGFVEVDGECGKLVAGEDADVFGSSGLSPDVEAGIGGLIGSGSGGLGNTHTAVECSDKACPSHGKQPVDPTLSATGATRPGGDPIILGALDATLMKRVVQGLTPALDACAAEHGGTGKVTIKFVVAKDGSVSQSSVKASTTGNAELDSCISAVFTTASFPHPKGGGIVIASWPILVI